MEKLTTRQRQALNSKRHILETAFELTNKMRFDKVKITDICEAAGVSVGAFYHYFHNKEELVLGWFELSDDVFVEEIMPHLMNSEKGIEEVVSDFAREQVLLGKKYGAEHMGQIYRAEISFHSYGFFSSERGIVKSLISILRESQNKGELSEEASAEDISHELLVIIRGNILDWIWGGTDAPEETAAQMVKRYIHTYKK